jgi:predicted ATPase/DNA-binding CsgD family transcriptional regulator
MDEAVPLQTMTGPGGVGKTRLALAIAQDVATSFADGVVWVDLAPLADAALVPTTIASALSVTPVPSRPLREDLARALRPRQLLLLLDNCEHVLDETAALVGFLLPRCPTLRVLATSRAPLHLQGEQILPIEPLPLPEANGGSLATLAENDAVRLFVARARAVRPAFALTEANAHAVATLCRQLDGLPLAIELAAARSTVLTPEALLAQMADRLHLLRGGARDAPARQQTMRDTIAWSYGLLPPAEQSLFRRLAVFVGGFTLSAAEAVGGRFAEGGAATPLERSDPPSPPSVLDGLTSLADHSLVRLVDALQSEPRYAMLETVREFALEQLAASGEADVIRGKHAAWYLALAEEEAEEALRGGPHQAHWLDRFEAELPNLRGALGWLEETGDMEAMMRLAGALGGLWFWGSHRREGAAWLERALAAADVTPTPGRGKALLVLAWQGMEQGGLHAVDYAAESVAVWTALGDAWRAADARLALGQILEYRADYERAIPLLEEAAREWDALGDPVRAAWAISFLGQAALDHEDAPRAEALYAESLGRLRQGGVAGGVSGELHQLGEVAAMRGDVKVAAAYYAESLDGTGTQENLVGKLVATGRLAAVGGHAETAARVLGAAEAIADTIGYVRRRPEQERLDRDAAVARAALGDARFEAAWAAGEALPAERAVAEALAVLACLGAAAAPSTTTPATVSASLSPREHQVLVLVCEHLTDPQIAERLFLSPRTVESHVASLLRKLDVANRHDAAAAAVRLGLV